MAVIDIKEFGGELPSTSPRNLPGNTGQAAKNLTNSTNEFLPLGNSQVISTTQSVVNPAAAVPKPKSLFRTAYLADGSPNTSLSTGWLVGAGEANVVRGQINGVTTERTYYTDMTGQRKFAWQDGTLVDRPMGVPAPLEAPAVTHVVVDEFRTSELDTAATDSRTLITNTLWAYGVPGVEGCEIAFTAPSAGSFGWLAHPTDPARRLLRVPFTDYAIREGFEFLQDPRYGGSKVTDGGIDFWQMDWLMYGRTWGFDAAALKAALLALPSPVAGAASLLTAGDADIAVAKAQAYFSQAVSPRAELIAEAKQQTNAVQRALQSVQDGALKTTFYASAAYKTGLNTLIGDGTVEGTVTNAILGHVYITSANTAFGEPGNVPESFITNPTRYCSPTLQPTAATPPERGER